MFDTKTETMKFLSPLNTNEIFPSLLLVLFILPGFNLKTNAQSDTIVPVTDPQKALQAIDIREITSNGIGLWNDDFTGHWAGIDFGFNIFLNEDYNGYESDFMDNDVLRSNSLSINFVQQSIGIQRYRNTIGLVTGLGLRFHSYRLDDHTTIIRDENSIIQPVQPEFENIKKSKLALISVVMPVLIEFQIPVNNNHNPIYFSGGVYGGLRLHSHTKVKYKEDRNEKLKVADHFSMHDFSYGIMVRTGFRRVNLHATYELVPLFREDKGPELTPFSLGITLLRF